jgi:hypothetical protein
MALADQAPARLADAQGRARQAETALADERVSAQVDELGRTMPSGER